MSKKKVASRSAMTLKDFHGGSIPSDLPLPSAPGMTVDRSVFERQGSGTWMSPTLGRGYGGDRSGYHRHGSSNGVRSFEDKSSYFPNPANIGRNYDEDERKPVDSRPRSSHSADRFDDQGYEERRGGYSSERYTLEDQGSFGSAPTFSEPRSSDRFPPSQITGTGFESDIYVHAEFGLIPVGPPPSREPQSQSRPQPLSYQRESSESRGEQPSHGQFQQIPSAASYIPNQQISSSPPRSWKNPLHQVQSSTSLSLLPPESATNVWTSRRDEDFIKARSSEPPASENVGSFPWRPHGMAARPLDTRTVDKVSPRRGLSDSSRHSGVHERLADFAAPVSEQVRESTHQKSYRAENLEDTVSGPDVAIQGDRSGRGFVPSFNKASKFHGGRVLDSDGSKGDSSERAGWGEEQSGGYGGDIGRQSYAGEELWSTGGGFSGTDRSSSKVDSERRGQSDIARVGFMDSTRGSSEPVQAPLSYTDSRHRAPNVADGLVEPIEQTRVGYRDASRVGARSTAVGPLSSNGPAPVDSWSGRLVEQTESLERPKLKLLPRSKPLEKIETSNDDSENVAEFEEGRNIIRSQTHDKALPEVLAESSVPKRPALKELGSSNDEIEEDGSSKVERPKLRLKPRSQPAEAETDEGSQKVRQLVFGGARPRELVLKERGVEDPLSGALDVHTPATASLPSSSSGGVKWEQSDVVKGERPDSRGDEKQDTRRYERQERSFERQGSHRLDRQESNREDRGPDTKWDLEKDNLWDRERLDSRRSKRDVDKQDSRRDADVRRDIDRQDSWRRPAESPAALVVPMSSNSTVSSLVDPFPRAPGRHGYSQTASAVELAQAFSRSSSIGSTMSGTSRGASSLRSPLSSIHKGSVHGFGPVYGNGLASPHMTRDTPFSRLAEASTPPFSANVTEISLQGRGFGLEGQNTHYGSGKLAGYGSGDLNRALSSGRSDLGSGFGLHEEKDDFPGKRGLPVRKREGYYD